jgi:AraC-like DNA-binding protein
MAENISNERIGRPARPLIVTTDDVAPDHRFEFWQHFCGEVNTVHVPDTPVGEFAARCESWMLGVMVLTRNTTPEMRLSRSVRQTARDGLDHIVLRVCRTGATVSRVGDREFSAAPRQLVVERLSDGYEDRWTASEWVSLNIAPADDPELCAALVATGTGAKDGVGAMFLGDFLLGLAGRMPQLDESDLPAAAVIVRAMIAHCLLGPATRLADAPTAVEAQQRVHAVRIVREHLGSARLDVTRLCQLTGFSRSTMYRMFERDGGVAAYIRNLRLTTAHAILGDLASAREPISSVAERCGYHCVASFNRAFRAEFGCTPGDVRAAARSSGDARPPRLPRDGMTMTLRDVLD